VKAPLIVTNLHRYILLLWIGIYHVEVIYPVTGRVKKKLVEPRKNISLQQYCRYCHCTAVLPTTVQKYCCCSLVDVGFRRPAAALESDNRDPFVLIPRSTVVMVMRVRPWSTLTNNRGTHK